jgi:hypothetical protein
MTETTLTLMRRAAKEAAVKQLVKTKIVIYREEIRGSISFSVSGVKECINQPFGDYLAKLDLIQNGLEKAVREAEYVGSTEKQTHFKAHVVKYHFFKTLIGGESAFFNVQETVQGLFVLYSITKKIREDQIDTKK